MIRKFRAFAWLRWRLMVNGLRGGQRRDRLEQISRALAFAGPFVLLALATGSVLVSGVGAGFAGAALAAGELSVTAFTRVATGILLMAFAVTAGFSLASPARDGTAHAPRLLLLPVPSWMLHLLDVAARVIDPWVALLLPGLAGLTVGLAFSGAPGAAFMTMAAGLALVTAQVSFSSVLGQVAGWVVRNRRRGEAAALLIPLTLALISFVPAAVRVTSRDRPRPQAAESAQRAAGPRADSEPPVVFQTLPPYVFAQAVGGTLTGGAVRSVPWLALIVGEAALLFAMSAAIHARLGTGAGDRSRSGRRRWPRMPTVPGLGRPATAVAFAQARTALRSVQGRMAVLFPGPVIAAVTAVALRSGGGSVITSTALDHGYLLFGVAALFALYSLQNVILNAFGSDRAGLTLQFLLPVSDLALARGKLAGCVAVFGVSLGLALVAALAVAPTGSPVLWLATLLAAASVCLVVLPVALVLSALFPVRADLSKLSRAAGGNRPHVVSMLLGMVLVPGAAVPPVLLLVGVPRLVDGQVFVLALTGLWLLVTMAIARVVIGRVAALTRVRRETLALVAQGR